MKLGVTLLAVLGAVVLLLGVGLILTYPLMLILNYVFTGSVLYALFGVYPLTFWKTYWLATALGWLFKSHNTSTK